VDGVSPNQVNGINLGSFITGQGHGAIRGYAILSRATVEECLLQYSVTLPEPLLSFELLREQLVDAAASGTMEQQLRHFASVYGAAGLLNSTVGPPRVALRCTSPDPVPGSLPHDSKSSALTRAQMIIVTASGTALLLCACLACLCGWRLWVRRREQKIQDEVQIVL
jgi:hypothetical protein